MKHYHTWRNIVIAVAIAVGVLINEPEFVQWVFDKFTNVTVEIEDEKDILPAKTE